MGNPFSPLFYYGGVGICDVAQCSANAQKESSRKRRGIPDARRRCSPDSIRTTNLKPLVSSLPCSPSRSAPRGTWLETAAHSEVTNRDVSRHRKGTLDRRRGRTAEGIDSLRRKGRRQTDDRHDLVPTRLNA